MKLQFGNFTLDDGTRQVLQDGRPIHLSPKAFDLLVTLILERPRALTKAELHKRLWPKTFVSDASLAMVVAEIRAALGESAKEPRHLRTLHRHGYAFQGIAREITQPKPVSRMGGTTQESPREEPVFGYWLVIKSDRIPLTAGDNVVGRDPDARVWLDSPSVSRRHAIIHVEDGGVTVEDLGSKNGTQVGDVRITSITPLADGNALRFGAVSATFRSWAADPTRTEADPS